MARLRTMLFGFTVAFALVSTIHCAADIRDAHLTATTRALKIHAGRLIAPSFVSEFASPQEIVNAGFPENSFSAQGFADFISSVALEVDARDHDYNYRQPLILPSMAFGSWTSNDTSVTYHDTALLHPVQVLRAPHLRLLGQIKMAVVHAVNNGNAIQAKRLLAHGLHLMQDAVMNYRYDPVHLNASRLGEAVTNSVQFLREALPETEATKRMLQLTPAKDLVLVLDVSQSTSYLISSLVQWMTDNMTEAERSQRALLVTYHKTGSQLRPARTVQEVLADLQKAETLCSGCGTTAAGKVDASIEALKTASDAADIGSTIFAFFDTTDQANQDASFRKVIPKLLSKQQTFIAMTSSDGSPKIYRIIADATSGHVIQSNSTTYQQVLQQTLRPLGLRRDLVTLKRGNGPTNFTVDASIAEILVVVTKLENPATFTYSLHGLGGTVPTDVRTSDTVFIKVTSSKASFWTFTPSSEFTGNYVIHAFSKIDCDFYPLTASYPYNTRIAGNPVVGDKITFTPVFSDNVATTVMEMYNKTDHLLASLSPSVAFIVPKDPFYVAVAGRNEKNEGFVRFSKMFLPTVVDMSLHNHNQPMELAVPGMPQQVIYSDRGILGNFEDLWATILNETGTPKPVLLRETEGFLFENLHATNGTITSDSMLPASTPLNATSPLGIFVTEANQDTYSGNYFVTSYTVIPGDSPVLPTCDIISQNFTTGCADLGFDDQNCYKRTWSAEVRFTDKTYEFLNFLPTFAVSEGVVANRTEINLRKEVVANETITLPVSGTCCYKRHTISAMDTWGKQGPACRMERSEPTHSDSGAGRPLCALVINIVLVILASKWYH